MRHRGTYKKKYSVNKKDDIIFKTINKKITESRVIFSGNKNGRHMGLKINAF